MPTMQYISNPVRPAPHDEPCDYLPHRGTPHRHINTGRAAADQGDKPSPAAAMPRIATSESRTVQNGPTLRRSPPPSTPSLRDQAEPALTALRTAPQRDYIQQPPAVPCAVTCPNKPAGAGATTSLHARSPRPTSSRQACARRPHSRPVLSTSHVHHRSPRTDHPGPHE